MHKHFLIVQALFVLGVGCGNDGNSRGLPYTPGQTTLIGGDECAKLDDECVDAQQQCGKDGAADVLLDDSGRLVDVICYPTTGVAVENYDGPVEDVGNNVVLVLDGADDGVDVDGDVTIDGNNVTLYGEGPDVSVIGGNLDIAKNNAVVRGVRVQGDVTIEKNNPSLVDCVIEGDLLIHGNNVSIALCEVWGKLTIEGNNAVLVSNVFAQLPEVKGNNTVCNDNVSFVDADHDAKVADDELGDAVVCAGKGK